MAIVYSESVLYRDVQDSDLINWQTTLTVSVDERLRRKRRNSICRHIIVVRYATGRPPSVLRMASTDIQENMMELVTVNV